MTIGTLGSEAAARYDKRNAFGLYGAGALYDTLTYGEFGRKIRQFAALLMDLGIRPGDRVLLLSENRPEWPVAYFGIALAGAVSVPLLTEFSASQVQTIAAHAEVSALCVTGKTVSKVTGNPAPPVSPGKNPETVPEGQGGLCCVPLIYMDSMETHIRADGTLADSIMVVRRGPGERIYFRDGGEDSGEGAFPVFPDAGEQDMASIIYTSGTTGDSKGVMLSHYNLLYTACATRSIFKVYPRDRFLSIVPLAHTYECTMGMLIAVLSGASTAYLDRPPAPAVLFPAAEALRPTVMLTVPLIIEKLYRNRILPALKANPLYRHPLTRAMAIRREGRRLLSIFGGAIRFFSIGGAPLAEDVETFLRKVQFPYTLGYGMTEASPLLAGTGPFKFPPHSVGRTLRGVELRIVDGEIQARGPNIMMGYFRDEERSAQSFTPDGWFKTGDLGFFDDAGYLYIKGRIKALILGPSGENIYPEEIEKLLGASDMVEDALVYPGEKGELVALVVLSEKARTMLAAIGDRLGELRNAVNKGLASFSRISRIEVRIEPFEKTATAKIKRFLYGKE
ncbi:MAG: AMP-binding protein [Spirochaetaceae bacterium]|nr:AMP-binding protein [Spirochaetaceae bacterium]